MKPHWTDKLINMGACSDAIEWARDYSSLPAAWRACKRADWMLWLLGEICHTTGQHRKLMLAACACARTALKYLPKDEKRPLVAIQTAERWARRVGGITLDDVRTAAASAYDAADAADTYAADAAYAASTAAAAYAAPWIQARTKALGRMSNIVRKHYPIPPRMGRKP